MNLLQKYATDLGLEEEGAWVDFGDGLEVQIARWGNEAFLRRLEALQKPYRHQIDRGTLPREIDTQIIDQLVAETIIMNWKGAVLDPQEGPLDCTLENKLKVLKNPRLKDFRQDVMTAAREADLYRQQELDEAEKNSVPGSASSSSKAKAKATPTP